MDLKELIALGIAEDIANKVVELHKEELKEFIPKARFNEVNEEKKALEETIKERDSQLNDLKKVNKEELEKEIARLQEENKAKDEQHEADMKELKIDSAVKEGLLKEGAKNATAVKALLKLDNLALDNEGNVIGLTEQIKALKEAEDAAFLFGEKVEIKGAAPGAPGDGSSGSGPVDPKKMSYSQIAEYLEKNPDAKL